MRVVVCVWWWWWCVCACSGMCVVVCGHSMGQPLLYASLPFHLSLSFQPFTSPQVDLQTLVGTNNIIPYTTFPLNKTGCGPTQGVICFDLHCQFLGGTRGPVTPHGTSTESGNLEEPDPVIPQVLQLTKQNAVCTLPCNDPKCQELGWVCVPLAVESYGNWGKEAQNTFARLASILSISLHCPILTEIYGRLNISLVRSVARAILSRRCSVPG